MVERILKLMSLQKLPASKLTAELGLESTTVSAWKSGKAKPRTEHIVKLANYFGVTTDYLFGLTDNPVPPDNPIPYVSPDELAIVEKLRALPSDKRKAIEMLLD